MKRNIQIENKPRTNKFEKWILYQKHIAQYSQGKYVKFSTQMDVQCDC